MPVDTFRNLQCFLYQIFVAMSISYSNVGSMPVNTAPPISAICSPCQCLIAMLGECLLIRRGISRPPDSLPTCDNRGGMQYVDMTPELSTKAF